MLWGNKKIEYKVKIKSLKALAIQNYAFADDKYFVIKATDKCDAVIAVYDDGPAADRTQLMRL